MERDNFVNIFTGGEVVSRLLHVYLEEGGISSMLLNEFSEGVHSGFADGIPGQITIKVEEKDVEAALEIIDYFEQDTSDYSGE